MAINGDTKLFSFHIENTHGGVPIVHGIGTIESSFINNNQIFRKHKQELTMLTQTSLSKTIPI
jgi:hypothetical protein